MTPDATDQPVLVVRDLRVDLDGTDVDIVRDISFEVAPGEILGVIGESGCGKTTVLTSLLGYTRSGARLTGGSIKVDGEELVGLSRQQLRHFRGGVVAYVPQDPAARSTPHSGWAPSCARPSPLTASPTPWRRLSGSPGSWTK